MSVRFLIVNADDLGSSGHTVEAIIECFERGALRSAAIMLNMPALEKAAAFAREHPEFSYGLHLCLTDERLVSEPAERPTLIAREAALEPPANSLRGTIHNENPAHQSMLLARPCVYRATSHGFGGRTCLSRT